MSRDELYDWISYFRTLDKMAKKEMPRTAPAQHRTGRSVNDHAIRFI